MSGRYKKTIIIIIIIIIVSNFSLDFLHSP